MKKSNNPFVAEVIGLIVDAWGSDSYVVLSDSYEPKFFGNASATFQIDDIIIELTRDRGDIFLSIGGISNTKLHPIETVKEIMGLPPRFTSFNNFENIKLEIDFIKANLNKIEHIFREKDIDKILWEKTLQISDEEINRINEKHKLRPT